MAGFLTNGLTTPISSNGTFPYSGNETLPLDTNLANGQAPQSIEVTTRQLLGFGGPYNLGNITGNVTIDFANGPFQTGTLTGNVTLVNPTNPVPGQPFTLTLVQDGTGSRTLGLGSQWLFSGNKTLTTTAAAIDQISGIYDGVTSKIRAVLNKAYA